MIIGCSKEEKQEDKYEGYIKIEEANLKEDGISTLVLVRFDGVLYGQSYSKIDYRGGTDSIGKIDKLIDSEYVPKLNNETNTKKILNALVYDKTDNSIVIRHDYYELFEKIDEKQ